MQTEIFHGHNIRTEIINDKLTFALADVCSILAIKNVSDVKTRLKEAYIENIDVWSDTNNRTYPTTFITERGLIRVLQTSRSPLAGPFQDWADERVERLMQGKTVDASGEVAESEDALILRAITTLQARVAEQNAELETARPKVKAYDRVLTPEHTFGFRDLCKQVREHFPVNEADVKNLLKQKKILLASANRLDARSAAIDAGWVVRRPAGKYGGKERFSLRFTTKTLDWLFEQLEPLEDAM